MLSATPWDSCDSGYKGCFPAPAGGQSSSGFLFFSLILCQPSSKLGLPHLQYCQASTPHLVPSLESFALKLGFAATVSHCICSRSVLLFPWFASFPISFPLCFSCFLFVSSGKENYFICLVWREHWSIRELFWSPSHLCKGFSLVTELRFCHAFLARQ
jgi:hypothetical protein